MTFPLRKILISIALIIILILGCLLIFGIRQYQLQTKLETVISQSEKMLFQFAAIREHIIESIVDNRFELLNVVIKDVESLHATVSDITGNTYIPNEYKLSFLNRIDLQGLILLLRQTSSGHLDNGRVQQLNRESRTMNERLLMFDRVIVDYAKSSIIAFQSIVIGALAIVVFIIVLILVMGHRYIAVPLLELAGQVRDVAQGRINDVSLQPIRMSTEVYNLGEAFHNLLQTRLLDSAEIARYNRIFYAIHKAGIAMGHARASHDLFRDVSRALRFNEDYCLVLISILDRDSGQLIPVVLEDSGSGNERIEQIDLAALLNDGSESSDKINPAFRAIRDKKIIVENDILAEIPKGYFKDTVFAQEHINCIALPLICDSKTYGAIVVYSGAADSFHKDEMKLLGKMASDIAFSLSFLETKNAFEIEKERTSAIVEAVGVMTFRLDSNGRLSSWDDKVAEITGFQPDELARKTWHDLVTYRTDGEKQAATQFMTSSEKEIMLDLLVGKKGGKPGSFRCRLRRGDAGGRFETSVICVCHDISELVRSQQTLESVQAEQRGLFDAIPNPVFILSDQGVIFDLNAKALAAFATQRQNILNNNIFPYVYRDRPVDYPSLFRNTLRERKKAVFRERFDNLAGEFLVTVVPLSETGGEEARMVVTVNDIALGTEQRIKEVIRIFQLTNLGELATGVAHEINNLSNGIINYAQVLADESIEKDCKLDQERMELLSKIIREGERIALIAQKLLFCGRENGKNKELIRINEVIDDVLLLVKHQFKNDGIKVDLSLPEGLQPVAFESSQLQLVFLNVLNNARRALNQRFSGKNEQKRIELKGGMESRNGKNWLKISITDWGVGISPEIMPRIFDPVFTTKPFDEDGGMGLAVSRELLVKNNGTIAVTSEPGNFTSVSIELPIQYS